VALFMSATVLGGAAGQWPAGLLSDRMDRGRLVVIMCALSLLMGAAVVAASGASLPWLLGAAAAWGAFAFPLYAVTVAQANDRAKPSEFVEVSSGLLLTYAAGAVVGPMIATGFMNAIRPGGLYVFTLLTHLLVAAVALVLLWRQRPVPEEEEEHVPFSEALQAAQTVSPTFDVQIQEALVQDTGKEPREDAPPADPGTPAR